MKECFKIISEIRNSVRFWKDILILISHNRFEVPLLIAKSKHNKFY